MPGWAWNVDVKSVVHVGWVTLNGKRGPGSSLSAMVTSGQTEARTMRCQWMKREGRKRVCGRHYVLGSQFKIQLNSQFSLPLIGALRHHRLASSMLKWRVIV